MKQFDFKKQVSEFLQSGVDKGIADELKKSFGVPHIRASKGVLLICALFDLAVNKGSVPAAKELISLGMGKEEGSEDAILSLISSIREEE